MTDGDDDTTAAADAGIASFVIAGRGDGDPPGSLLLPAVVDPYQTVLITYGLIMAIAALGFNLLLGYTGLLSFGHSAYFGTGAYTVAFIVRDLGAQSMELCIIGGLVGTVFVSALFGFVCVRHRASSSASDAGAVAGAVERTSSSSG
jgi:ABC-type branched-subunit amino acid transport system permease subunit